MKHRGNLIITIFFLVLLIGVFIFVNIFGFDNNNANYIPKVNKNIEPLVKDTLYKDTIYIDGKEITVYTIEYISHLGFKIKYESSKFDIKHLSNGALFITSEEDENNYVKIEKLQQGEYYKQYEKLNLKEDIVDNYLVNYHFLKSGFYNFIKVTKSINKDNKEIDAHLDYIINSLSFTS